MLILLLLSFLTHEGQPVRAALLNQWDYPVFISSEDRPFLPA
jgi:hypothetical protein